MPSPPVSAGVYAPCHQANPDLSDSFDQVGLNDNHPPSTNPETQRAVKRVKDREAAEGTATGFSPFKELITMTSTTVRLDSCGVLVGYWLPVYHMDCP